MNLRILSLAALIPLCAVPSACKSTEVHDRA
jgi:Protein of unknown function (DUF2959)